MARIQNPYAPQTPIGASIVNLGEAIFGGPSPNELEQQALQTQLLRAQIGGKEDDARKARAARDAQSGIANLVGQVADQGRARTAPVADPGVAGPARALAATGAENVRTDARQFFDDLGANYAKTVAPMVDTPKDAGELFRFVVANNRNFNDDDVIRSMAGQGSTIGVNDAVSLQGQTNVRSANVAGDIAKEAAKPLSETQARGAAFNALPAGTQATAVGPTLTEVQGGFANRNVDRLDNLTDTQKSFVSAQPTQPTPRNYVTPSGASGVTLDGRTDAQTGERLPAGVNVYTGQVSGTDTSGLTTSSRTAAQERNISLNDFLDLSHETRQVAAADPTLFGVAGNVRRLAQNVVQQLQSARLIAGGSLDDALGQAEADIFQASNDEGTFDPSVFDPNLSDIEKLATLLAYNGASALAGQSGRGLSDRDFKTFRQVIGDPAAWTASQPAFLAGLDRLDRLVKVRLASTPGARVPVSDNPSNQPDGPPPPPPPGYEVIP